jgi:hypothetical protein
MIRISYLLHGTYHSTSKLVSSVHLKNMLPCRLHGNLKCTYDVLKRFFDPKNMSPRRSNFSSTCVLLPNQAFCNDFLQQHACRFIFFCGWMKDWISGSFMVPFMC